MSGFSVYNNNTKDGRFLESDWHHTKAGAIRAAVGAFERIKEDKARTNTPGRTVVIAVAPDGAIIGGKADL